MVRVDPNAPHPSLFTKDGSTKPDGHAAISCPKCNHRYVCRFIPKFDAICNAVNVLYFDDPDIPVDENGDKPMCLVVDNGLIAIHVRCQFFDPN